MIKSRHIIRLVTILAALCLLFSISSLAEDATPSNFRLIAASSGPTWSNWNPGNNVWYDQNGVPHYQTFGDNETYYGDNNLLGSPIFAPQAGVGRSEFHGSSKLNTSSNLLGGTREYLNNTFDSNFEADADGLTTSYASLHGNTFTSSKQASVTANNGTVMEMYDNNFNGNTTVTAASGGTVNLTLGNSTEMTHLLDSLDDIVLNMLVFKELMTGSKLVEKYDGTTPNETYSITYKGKTATGSYIYIYFQFFDFNNNTLSRSVVRMSGSFVRLMMAAFMYLNNSLNAFFRYLQYTIATNFSTYWDAYYPLKDLSLSQYWIAYNTDTGEYDHVNIATVLGYITWYLGQLYNDSSNVTETMHTMTEDINTAATTFQDMEQKEHAAIEQIQSGFETFLPDVNQFGSFKAITWCSNYLQQIYLSLGSYGTVIFIALLFGVCLQFIGYFRYK